MVTNLWNHLNEIFLNFFWNFVKIERKFLNFKLPASFWNVQYLTNRRYYHHFYSFKKYLFVFKLECLLFGSFFQVSKMQKKINCILICKNLRQNGNFIWTIEEDHIGIQLIASRHSNATLSPHYFSGVFFQLIIKHRNTSLPTLWYLFRMFLLSFFYLLARWML